MIRILLVDDQRLFVESLKLVLTTRAEDISVVGIANNGQEALEMTNELKPDIVLMDVRMPQMDGVEAVCRIISQDPGIRVIMLTTFDDDNYVLDALNNGAAGYILKDVPPEELITSIRAVHGGSMLISPSVARKVLLSASPKAKQGPEIDTPLHPFHAEGFYREHPTLKYMTSREIEVLNLIGQGYNNQEIADRLFISLQTAKNHVSIIYSKLNIHNRAKVVHFVNTLE